MTSAPKREKVFRSLASIIFVSIGMLACDPSRSTLEKWYKNNEEGRILSLLDETLSKNPDQIDPYTQQKRINLIADFIIKNHPEMTQRKMEYYIYANKIKENQKLWILDSLADSTIKPLEYWHLTNFYFDCPIDSKLDPGLTKYLSRASSSDLYAIFIERYRKAIQSSNHQEALKLATLLRQIDTAHKNLADLMIKYLNQLISIEESIQKIQKDIETSEGIVNDDTMKLSAAEESYISAKTNLDHTFNLHAFLISQIQDSIYEIDAYGQRALLMTTNTQFSSRGFINLPVRKVMNLPVQLKEQFGGFTQQWPVLTEVDPKADELDLKQCFDELTRAKIKLTESQTIMTKNRETLKNQQEIESNLLKLVTI